MVIIYKKENLETVPEDIRKRLTFKRDSIEIDDRGITRPELAGLIKWLTQEGYVEQ